MSVRNGRNWVMAVFVAVAIVLGGTTGVLAADEQQIKEMMKLIEEQQKQIDALKAKLEAMSATQTEQIEETEAIKKAQAQMAESAVPALPEEGVKGLVQSGNDKVSVKLYGQVNRGFLVGDDGNSTDTYFVDNDNSSTRVGMLAHVMANDDLKVGSKFEVEFESNSSSAVNQENKNKVGPNSFNERHFDFYLDSKKFGKLSLGQGDTASNSTSEVDLSGTSLIGYSGTTDFMGSYLWYDTEAEELSGAKIKDVMTNMDGMSRDDRVRYDTPGFYGFRLSAGIISGPAYDAALRYAQKFPGVKVAGAIGYANPDGDVKSWDDQFNGSISVLLDMGLNLTLAAGTQDFDGDGRDDPKFWYGKLGYRTNFSDIGTTAFSIDYGEYDDINQNQDEAKTVGIQFVQKVDSWATEFYAGFRWHELDRPNHDLDRITGFMTGARIKF